MSDSSIPGKPEFFHAYDLARGDRNFWKGCQPFEALKVVGEVTGVVAAGVEVPVRCLSCPAVTGNLGIGVWGESTSP